MAGERSAAAARPGRHQAAGDAPASAADVTGAFWEPGTATGVGSMPGTEALSAARDVLERLPALPHLVELPERGVGADLVGRATALLMDLPVDLQPAGWRLVSRPSRDLRRTRDLLNQDLDALEEAAQGYTGPLKVQAAGPWTLAAHVELPRGDKVLADAGACRDLAEALAAGLAGHVADIRRRVPGVTTVLVQLDEPSLAAVLAGHVRTASGFDVLRVPGPPEIEAVLQAVTSAVAAGGGIPGAHTCSATPPLRTLVAGGARWLGVDATLLTPRDDDGVGEALEAGVRLIAGLVPTRGAPPPVGPTVASVVGLLGRLGAPDRAPELAVSPTCGLAGAAPKEAGSLLARAGECARELAQ